MDVVISFQKDGSVHVKNNNYFATYAPPTIDREITDCYYLIDHPYEILCGCGVFTGTRLITTRPFNVIYADKKYTIKDGNVPADFIPEGPSFTKHITEDGNIEVKIFDFFTRGALDELAKDYRGREFTLLIDDMNELQALFKSCHRDIIWGSGSVRIKYRGELLPCEVPLGGYNSIVLSVLRRPELKSVELGYRNEIVDMLMKRFPHVPIQLDGRPVYDDVRYGDKIDSAKSDLGTARAILKKGCADRKFDLTYKLIVRLGSNIDWNCSVHMNDFKRMKEIENNPMFDSYTDNIPFKYIPFGYNPDGADPFIVKFYEKFNLKTIGSLVRNFHLKKYIDRGMGPVFVGSSLIKLFGYADGADHDVITTACDPAITNPKAILRFTPDTYHYRGGRLSVTAPDGKKLDIFKTRKSYHYVISKFHVPCVRMFIKGNTLYMTPSCMESLYTGTIERSLVGEIFTKNGTIDSILKKYEGYGFKIVD